MHMFSIPDMNGAERPITVEVTVNGARLAEPTFCDRFHCPRGLQSIRIPAGEFMMSIIDTVSGKEKRVCRPCYDYYQDKQRHAGGAHPGQIGKSSPRILVSSESKSKSCTEMTVPRVGVTEPTSTANLERLAESVRQSNSQGQRRGTLWIY
jgi:hypothetical protein